MLQTGRNTGAWDGAGIITSMTDAQGASALTDLGVATGANLYGLSGPATRLWNGQTIDANSVLVKYTYAGDADLNGRINADDFFQIDRGYGHTSADRLGYFNGDFNYDGVINGDDYFLIDSNFGGQGPAL